MTCFGPWVVKVLCSVLFFMSAVQAAQISTTKWQGEVQKGAEAYLIENQSLKVTVLKKGAWVISVFDKANQQEFINNQKAYSSMHHGIYDRINLMGRHSYRLDDKHITSREYAMKDLGGGSYHFSCTTPYLKVERTLSFSQKGPSMRVDVKYTWLKEEKTKLKITLMTQANIGNSDISFNQVVVMPDGDGVKINGSQTEGHYVDNPQAGWWFIADRVSKKSVLMTYPQSEKLKQTYLYRIAKWFHLFNFKKDSIVAQNESLTQTQTFTFLSKASQLDGIGATDLELHDAEYTRMKATLKGELAKNAVFPGMKREALKLPALAAGPVLSESPGDKPLASIAFLRSAVYDHPKRVNRQLWTSVDKALEAVAQIAKLPVDWLVVAGATFNGLDSEFKLSKDIAALSGKAHAFIPNSKDMKNVSAYEKHFGQRNWVSKIGDVSLIAFAPGEEAWLKTQIEKAKGRVVVMGEKVSKKLAQSTKVNLALIQQRAKMPSFARFGNWPVVHVPRVQDYGVTGYLIVEIHKEYLAVRVKNLEQDYGPYVYLDRDGKSAPLGIPPFVKGKPILKVAHIADTQLKLPKSVQRGPGGVNLDQHNTTKCIEELNQLKIDHQLDYVVNAGDLVNTGSSHEEWHLYLKLFKNLKLTCYEVLGNHDCNGASLDGKHYKTDMYEKYIDDPLTFAVEKNGILCVGLATMATKPAELRAFKSKAEKAKCTYLVYHDPINPGKGGYTWWTKELYDAALSLGPSITMAGHTHRLQWKDKAPVREFIASGIGWTKYREDITWNGYYLHTFFEDRVVSSYKRMGCDDIFFTFVTEYRTKPKVN